MQETVRVTEQKFKDKVKEVLTLLGDLDIQKKIVAEKIVKSLILGQD